MKIKAFPLFVSNSGCDYHRVKLPFMYGGQYYDHQYYNGFKVPEMMDNIAKSEVLVINRTFPLGVDRLAEMKEKHGFKVVVDMDDWWQLPWNHPLHRQYKEKASKEIIGCIRLADAVTVTTKRLADKIRLLNSNVHIIPNALPFGYDQFAEQPEGKSVLFKVIYAGQSSHLEDVRTLIGPFKRVKQLHGIGFQLAGYIDSPVWRDIEKVFSCMPNYERIEQRPLDDYMPVYNGASCVIVPLVDNEFNRHKSNLKLLEAAAKKLPVICSHVPPYSDCADAPVLWVKKQSDWYDHIKYLSRDRSAAKQLGEALHAWAIKRHNLFEWNQVRFDLYKNVAYA